MLVRFPAGNGWHAQIRILPGEFNKGTIYREATRVGAATWVIKAQLLPASNPREGLGEGGCYRNQKLQEGRTESPNGGWVVEPNIPLSPGDPAGEQPGEKDPALVSVFLSVSLRAGHC